jgi:hypothetical protein
LAAVLTEIHLCGVCSCQERLRRHGADGQTAGWEPSLPALLTEVCTPTPPGTEVCFDEAALQQFFTTLRLDSLGIRRIDPMCAGFQGLERLCLVGNEITTVRWPLRPFWRPF